MSQPSHEEINYFPFPLAEIRMGFYTAVYFNRAKQIAHRELPNRKVTMQVFQKRDNVVVCGINEVIQLLKEAAGRFRNWQKANKLFSQYLRQKEKEIGDWKLKTENEAQTMKLDSSGFKTQASKQKKLSPSLAGLERKLNDLFGSQYEKLTIHALPEGSKANAWETVMHIEGPYSAFAHLESLYLGILARRTMVATNTRRVVEAAQGKPVLFFSDRFDHFLNQPGDGYAAKIGGAYAVCTDAMGSLINEKGVGTIPHALIALFNGDTVKAAKAFAKHYPKVPLIALVDFDNNCPGTSLEVARALGKKLWGVRLDTATNLIDRSLQHLTVRDRNSYKDELYGVNPLLVKKVRQALDGEGFRLVKIVVSGGFNPERIRSFEQQNCPVDAYGVGSYLVKGNFDYTADVVKVEGKPLAKVGRRYRANKRLKKVSTEEVE